MKEIKQLNPLKSLYKFDDITKFRLINAFIVSVCLGVLSPVLIVMKGLYMLPWVISLFSILYTVSVKTNKYLVPLGNEKLYRIGVILHVLLILNTTLYFWFPSFMIYSDSIVMFFIYSNFSAYSISLTNYITEKYPDTVPEFQIAKNSINADGTIIGLIIASLVTAVSLKLAVIVFLILNNFFSIYMIWNWNFFRASEPHKYFYK